MPKAIVIPADAHQPVRTVEWNGIDELQSLVGGWFETSPNPRNDVAHYYDEEGKLKGLPRNDRATALIMLPEMHYMRGDYIAGDCVFNGFDVSTGDDTDIPDDYLKAVMALPTSNLMNLDPTDTRDTANFCQNCGGATACDRGDGVDVCGKCGHEQPNQEVTT